ncbi:myosin-13 isoform X2 [Micractinium conductrix]|uniref:Myosin-13 isoform X2 n=1 Tax=Micractinium conductrix TaxID=554055 RepID=A0A2P6V5E4_9CHLO|nr:myosin-13 isoform X2 [Micractinium conductrix]|eukprot:PSC69310.1 myosin-13 isoform X2 [Micractinium conductrix]
MELPLIQPLQHAVLAAFFMPWNLAVRGLSWACALQIHALTMLTGATPEGYVQQSKVTELESVVAHLLKRESSYRAALAELQEALDAKEGARKKALHALKKARMESDQLAEQLSQLQEGGLRAADARVARSAGLSPRALHSSFSLLVLAAAWFLRCDIPSLQRKVAVSLMLPLCWTYLTALVARKPQPGGTLLLCACWFLLGFIAAHKFLSC